MHLSQAAGYVTLGAGLFQIALLCNAQQAPPPPTLAVQVQLVNLPVVVRDKNGAFVTTLSKDDFALAVDNRQQPIRYFDRDNNLPLTLGLLIDISGSVRSVLEDERIASEDFLDQMMISPVGRPPDEAFLVQFAHEVDVLQDRTSSVPRLRTALQRVGDEPHNSSENRGNSGYGGYGRHGGFRGGTALYDAIYSASTDLMMNEQGRKAIVLLTDGEDRGSNQTMNNAIAAAQRAETVVYAIYFQGEQHGYGGYGRGGLGGHGGGFPGGGGRGGEQHVDGRKVLEQITKETGGRMFEVSPKQTFAAIYTQIGEELRSQYRLGYVPDASAASVGFHRIELTLPKNKRLFVQTRAGYYLGE